jgi:hypothetical protein
VSVLANIADFCSPLTDNGRLQLLTIFASIGKNQNFRGGAAEVVDPAA